MGGRLGLWGGREGNLSFFPAEGVHVGCGALTGGWGSLFCTLFVFLLIYKTGINDEWVDTWCIIGARVHALAAGSHLVHSGHIREGAAEGGEVQGAPNRPLQGGTVGFGWMVWVGGWWLVAGGGGVGHQSTRQWGWSWHPAGTSGPGGVRRSSGAERPSAPAVHCQGHGASIHPTAASIHPAGASIQPAGWVVVDGGWGHHARQAGAGSRHLSGLSAGCAGSCFREGAGSARQAAGYRRQRPHPWAPPGTAQGGTLALPARQVLPVNSKVDGVFALCKGRLYKAYRSGVCPSRLEVTSLWPIPVPSHPGWQHAMPHGALTDPIP